jgi:hypothetical protein
MFDVKEMADRYVSIWNESSPEARAKLVRDLWSEDAMHIVETPDEMRERAHELGFPAPRLVVHGHEELERRTAQAHASFVETGEYAFRNKDNASRLDNLMKVNWEMVSTADGTVAAEGLNVFILGDDDRIHSDYLFIER